MKIRIRIKPAETIDDIDTIDNIVENKKDILSCLGYKQYCIRIKEKHVSIYKKDELYKIVLNKLNEYNSLKKDIIYNFGVDYCKKILYFDLKNNMILSNKEDITKRELIKPINWLENDIFIMKAILSTL